MVEADGFTVVCADGRFKVTRVQPTDGKKIEAGEWAKSVNLAVKATIHVSPSCRPREGGDPVVTERSAITGCPHCHGHSTMRLTNRNSQPCRVFFQSMDHQTCPPLSISHRSPTSKFRRPPRSGRSSTSRRKDSVSAPENLEPYGHYKAKVSMDYVKSLQDKPNGKLILVTRHHADAGRRGQDHHHGGPDRRAQLHRQEGDAVPARAVARPVLRHEGRRRRRRLRPGRADGGHQPALHRRLPRHHLGEQSARGDARQSHLLGQWARHRRAPRRLAPRARHERPRAAQRSSARSAASPTDFRARTVSTSPSPPR